MILLLYLCYTIIDYHGTLRMGIQYLLFYLYFLFELSHTICLIHMRLDFKENYTLRFYFL